MARVALAVITALLAAGASAVLLDTPEADARKARKCGSVPGTVGPAGLVFDVRARGVDCPPAKRVAKRYFKKATGDSIIEAREEHRVRAWRCKHRPVGLENWRVKCRRNGGRDKVRFNFGF